MATHNSPQADTAPATALGGLRVLDLSRVLAGPWASQTLGDLGAEIIKVERPGEGDDTRHWGPPYVPGSVDGDSADAAYFMCTNRNKKSVAIDISSSEGQALVRKLAACSDVVIENFKLGGLARYGLDYDSLKAVNPGLVYCSITGFGQTGPYANRPGYDFLVQGMCGLMSVTGRADGSPGAGPLKVGVALTDILTGMYASTAILAALRARDVTGMGQHIDLALLDVGVACLANQNTNYLYGGKVPGRMGNEHPNTTPYQDFPTADGHMIVAVGNDGQFKRFCIAAGRPEWAEDERFRLHAARLENREALISLVRARTRERTTQSWVATFEQAGVPCGPINTIADVFQDAQVRARGMLIDLPHRRAGEVPIVASPIRLSGTPVQYHQAPPVLGQDTRAVLQGLLDVPTAALDHLVEQGVIQ